MIISFGDAATADLYHGRQSKRARRFPSTIVRVALRKLDMINAAYHLEDLREPPGNHLEALKGELKDSIAFASMTNGVSLFAGQVTTHQR